MQISLDVLRMAQAHATHAGLRQRVIAQNIANADTPGYRAQDAVPFDRYLRATRDATGTAAPMSSLVRPDVTQGTRAPDGNSVSLEREMVRAAETRQSHELALGIYAAVRDLMRASLGR